MTTKTGREGNLVDALKAKQKELKLNESQFAKRLGVSRAIWFLIKRGDRQPGFKFLQAVVREFPDLQLYVYQFMSSKV